MSYKTLKLVLTVGILLIVIVSVLMGCRKPAEDAAENGKLTVEMTDAPGDYLEVNAHIKSVEVHSSTQGWVSLPTKTGIYNLLGLRNEVKAIITDTILMPTGRISQIRLVLGDSNTIMLNDSSVYPLTVSSGSSSGLKINVQANVLANRHVSILLDFDAALSVILTGSNDYKLSPVVNVKEVIVQ